MRRKQITGADLLSELHSYNGNDKRYSESKVTEAAKAVDNGNYQESETAAEYAMKKLKAHYGVEDQDNNEDIAQLAQSGLQKLEQYYGTRNQMSSVNTIQSGIQEGQNRYFNEDSELPTSGRIIQTMDDRAIEEALKIAKGRMQQSDEAYTEKFRRSPEATIEHSRQAAQIDRYQNELDSRNEEREKNTYYKKREDALNALTDEQRSNLEEYVNATREMNNTSKISGAMGGTSMITENLQNEAIDKKNAAKKALEDSGIKNLDVLAQYMGEIQDEKNTIRINDSIKKDVDKHPVLAGTAYSALDVAMSPAAGLTAAVETLKRPYYADPSAPVNTNSDAYALTNFSNATESAVSDKIDNKYGQFAYGVGMSTAKSAYSVALGSEIVGGLGLTGKAAKTVGNIVTLPEFGASAYATTLQQDQANGVSIENSIKHATAAGINEMLFEVVSLDHAWDILHRSGKTAAKEAIVSTLAQAGIEGTEEGFTDIANAIADNIINGDQSEYNRNVQNYVSLGYTEQEAKDRASKDFMGEIAQDVLAGAISGGIMGGITNTANAVNYHKLGAHIETTTELKNNVLDVAEQMDESTTAKQIIEEKGRENLNAEDLGEIVQSMAEESDGDIQDVLTERFAELGETNKQARKDAKEIIKAVTTPSEEVTNEENDTRTQKFEANPNLSTVYAETLEGKHTAVNDTINNVQSSYHYAQMEKKGRDSHTGVTRAVVKSTGEKQIVIDVQNVSGNHATVRMSNGTLKDLSEIEIPDRNLRQLYNFSTTMDTATVANTLINNWDNEEVAPYVRASAVFYNAGKLGTSSFESLMNNPKNAQLVMSVNNPATLKAMYTLGQNNSQRAEVAPVQQQKNINGSEQKEKAGKVVDLRTDKADGRMVRVAEHVAKKTGLEITLNDSLEHGENGHFSQALSRIALSSTSHNEYETLIHELNEWANTYNPEGMRKVMDAVLDYAQTKEGATYLSDRIQKYYDTYKRVESDKTYEGSADEFVFDYLAGVFSTEEGVKDFSNYMTEENISQKEQKSILETVADFFKELYDKIVSFLDDHVLSETAKKGLEADAEKAQEIRDMVLGVWSEAEENFGNNAEAENDMKFSINVNLDEELKKYNIENKLNDYIAVQKAVVNHLKGTGFFDKNSTVVNEETGMQIRINPRGIKETLANGKRFQSLPRELKKLKIATIEQLPEIIKRGKLIEDNIENTHGENSLYAYFETPVEINGGNYKVRVNIRKTIETNKFWIHNVILEKDSELLNPTRKQGIHEIQNPSENIISQTEKNETKKYSIDIDDSFFDALYGEPSEHETEMSSIIQEGFEALKNVEVNERMMHKIAYAIKKENKSTYDIDKLASNLTKVFAYLKEHKNADYNDMIRIVQEVAKPVIEESTDVDPYEQQAYKDVRDYVKGLNIRLNDEQKAEVAYYYGSYEKFRKMNFGSLNFTDKGTYLDNLWTEIADNSYQMLDYDVSSADQPMALVDMLNQLKPTKKNIFGMDKEQAAYDLALDIYRRFFLEQAQDAANKKVYEKTDRLIVRQQEYRKRVKAAYDESLAKLRTVEAEKRKQQAARYEEKIADLKNAQQAALANADKKAAKKYQDDIVSWNRWLTRANQRADRTEQRMLELKVANRNNTLAKRRNQEMSSMRERIKKNANGIISYFNTNTDKKHVPEALKESVAKFITSIDFVSERANPDSTATMAWRESLNQMYRKLSDRNAAVEGNYEDIFNALMDQADGNKSTLLSDMSDFINANENVRITDMNANQLKQLDELITRLKRTITTVNQLYVNKRTNDARKLGADTIAELEQKKNKKLHANRTVQAVENLLDVNMMDARSYFYRLGDTAGSIYDGLRTAFNDRVWLLKEAQTYMENALDGINTKDWTGDNAKVHTFMIRGKELQMTTAQIMSLYELRKRNQALLHMKVGGIRPKDITTAKKNVDISKSKLGKEVISRVKPIQLTEYDIDHVICSVLTPEQIKIADAMQQFMANNCADWGNKTTMMMNGYKRFGVKSYFPIKVDGNSVDTKDQTAYWATQNNSFTKQTRERAANALIVDDIFDVFTKHVTDMATYSTFTAPLSDAMKWFNHRNVEFDGDIAADTDSVQRQIELTYGKEYLEYFKKLIKDINAESVNGIESQIASTLVSKMKAASVGGNLRVAIQQPTAYIRAAAVMNPKYMAQAVFKKSAMKKAKENSAITQWKSWGYFETSIGQSMKSVITGQQSLKENLVEKSMILAQLGDDVTWGYLWNACEVEIKDKHPDVKYDSKEFIKMVAERFDEIVDQTQVVDSVLHRSQIMRSQDKLVQMATAFMAEPTKSYNLLVNAVRDASEKKSKSAMKRLGRVVTAYTATQVMNAAIVAVIDAARDLEDDDKTFWDKYIENLKGNIVDNMNPISMIPFAKDIVSIFQGYDISRLDMQGISKLYAGANNMRKYITDPDYREKHTFYDVAKETARGVSLVTGIPGFNVLRDIESLYHAVTGKWLGGIIRSNTRQYQRSVDALLDGNTEEYNSIMQELSDKNVEEDKIDSGIMSELKKRYTAGEMEKSTVENILKDQFEMDDNDIYYKLKKWENGSDWTKYSDFYSAMDNAYETGKINDRDKIKAEIDDLKKHGVKEETIKSQITEKYKQIYLEAKKNGNYADLKNLLISAYMMCGDSHSEAMKKIDNWSKQKKS